MRRKEDPTIQAAIALHLALRAMVLWATSGPGAAGVSRSQVSWDLKKVK